ncbi:MAG: arginine--tRNA ligase [Candidatus Woesearchaeota archaeon]
MDFNYDVINILKEKTELDENKINDLLEVPPNKKFGDVAFPCFILAKKFKKNPNEISKDLSDEIDLSDYSSVTKVTNKGPYLNFYYNQSLITKNVLENFISIEKDFKKSDKDPKTIVVEFPAPNTNKPLHLGHVRNLILSESVCRLLESQGHDVKRVNLNNDRGIHICKSMLAYKKWGNEKEPDKKSDHFVGDYYVLYNKKLKDNPELEKENKEMLKKWESGDDEVISLWTKMRKWALEGFKETYDRFDVEFDKEYFESEIYKDGKKIIEKAYKEGKFDKNEEGAIIIDLDNLGEKVLLRSDGTSLYITQDIALAFEKYNDFDYDKSIYVVGNEQEYHFKVLFKVLSILGFSSDTCYHLSYGMINLPSGKMKSREGNVVDADNLADDLKDITLNEVQKRNDLSKEKLDEVSEKISMAALRYFILKYSPRKDFTFRPKESISLEGETGPYLQYSLVRANRILEKSNDYLTKNNDINYDLLFNESEIDLIKHLSNFDDILEKCADDYSPHHLANYGYELASLFNTFYEKNKVIGIEDEEKSIARLKLVKVFSNVMHSVLYYLGIKKVNVM